MSPKLLRPIPLCGILLFATGCAYSADPGQPPPPLPKTVSPSLAKVKPPLKPTISPFFISDKDLDKLPEPTQPKALHDALADLEKGTIEQRVAKLKAKVVADLVYVQGGSFMRGDFAKLMGVPGVTRMTYNEDDKDVRKITLSDFWISKYKTTYAEFDVFTDATRRKRTGMEKASAKYRNSFVPAGTYWQEAKDYCQWLGKITGYPFDLPTEAQWEYAARSRGQFFMIATDNGDIEYGKNIPYSKQAERLSPTGVFPVRYPVGLFPPNPIGLYDMSYDGKEWVNDWYAENAYTKATDQDPQGPTTGTQKVIRGWAFGDSLKIGVNVWRRKEAPIPMMDDTDDDGKLIRIPYPTYMSPNVRCAVSYRQPG